MKKGVYTEMNKSGRKVYTVMSKVIAMHKKRYDSYTGRDIEKQRTHPISCEEKTYAYLDMRINREDECLMQNMFDYGR